MRLAMGLLSEDEFCSSKPRTYWVFIAIWNINWFVWSKDIGPLWFQTLTTNAERSLSRSFGISTSIYWQEFLPWSNNIEEGSIMVVFVGSWWSLSFIIHSGNLNATERSLILLNVCIFLKSSDTAVVYWIFLAYMDWVFPLDDWTLFWPYFVDCLFKVLVESGTNLCELLFFNAWRLWNVIICI